MIERIIVLGILALCIIYFIRISNKIVKLDVKVQEAYADIEVSLIKRYSKRCCKKNICDWNIVAFITGKRSIQFLKDESKAIKGGLL